MAAQPVTSPRKPMKYLGHELLNDQFGATIGSLADDAALQIQRLRASRDKAGRPRLEAFRQLGEDLIRVYRTLGAKKAVPLEWDGFCRVAVVACRPEWGRGVQRATQEPRCRAGRRPNALPDRELHPTWHPVPRPRSFPEDADSERLLDGYFEPRLGYFKLTLKRRHARDFAKGAVRPRRASQSAR
jgi:hypothetical protein